MNIQELTNMKFFFWNDTLQREYRVIQERIDADNEQTWKSDTERMSTLTKRYYSFFKPEIQKVVKYVEELIETVSIKKEHVDIDIEEMKYTCILKQDQHQFVIKAYVGLNQEPYISIIVNTVEKKFKDLNSLIQALKNLSLKISGNKEASIKISADFESALRDFLADSLNKLEKYYEGFQSKNQDLKWFYKLVAMKGSKFVKIISMSNIFEKDKDVQEKDFSSKSAWAFIDKTSGDIFKPNNWSSPHPTPRANVFDKQTWKNVGPLGPNYLR